MSRSEKLANCNRCGEEIYFDTNIRSKYGKQIPLDPITNQPHDCPNSAYRPERKSIGSDIMDLEERERERIKRNTYK